ncbi:MAG: sulfatase [Caldilineales bacterium]|nr:sulfatase [Caldilineales bacterium]
MTLPNILLLVLDCVRADGLGCYGNPRLATPRLDELAARGRRYTQARSAAIWTLPSHASIFTGLHPRQHGVNVDNRWLDAGIPTMAETLSSLGYQTAAFSTNAWVGPHFGLDRGFEDFHSLWRIFPGMGHRPFPWWEKALRKGLLERRDKGAEKLNSWVQRWWLRQRDPDRPFFIFGLYLDAHLPYRPPKGFAERLLPAPDLDAARKVNQDAWAYMAGEVVMDAWDFDGLRALYDAEIAYVDQQLGKLLDFLRGEGALENTVIIVTADHGENIGDHDLMDHQYCVYDSLAHVPLIIHFPEAFAVGIDETPVQHTDLFPTLLDLIGHPGPIPLPGRSIVESALQPPTSNLQPAIIQYTTAHRHRFARRHPDFDPASHGYDRTFDAIVSAEHKLIRSNKGEIELYDLADDPAEACDLAEEQPQRANALSAQLDDWLEEHSPPGVTAPSPTLDPDLANHLRRLGYL